MERRSGDLPGCAIRGNTRVPYISADKSLLEQNKHNELSKMQPGYSSVGGLDALIDESVLALRASEVSIELDDSTDSSIDHTIDETLLCSSILRQNQGTFPRKKNDKKNKSIPRGTSREHGGALCCEKSERCNAIRDRRDRPRETPNVALAWPSLL